MRRVRGFTIIEVAMTVAIIAVVAALAYSSFSRMRPRATLADASADVAGLLYNARQNALATGHYTVVMVFPSQASSAGGTGRLVAYEDPSYTFMSASAAITPRFCAWDASTTAAVSSSNLIGSVELPRGISFGLGGSPAPSLAAPYDGVTGTASDFRCNFCSTASGSDRGAIVFDSRGRARFFDNCGTDKALVAGTLAITGSPDVSGYRLFLITPSTGAVRPLGTG